MMNDRPGHFLSLTRALMAFAASLLLASCTPVNDVTAAPGPSWDADHRINPATNLRTSGPYDWEDLYRGPDGFLLPGDAQIR
jgi:hypothetical protein